MNKAYKLNRKKVLKIASELYRTGGESKAVEAFVRKYYPKYSDKAVAVLVSRATGSLTWGRAQSIAWSMARHEVKNFRAFVSAIQADPEFIARPKFYTVPTGQFTIQGQQLKTEVIFTTTYGELPLSSRLKAALAL